MKKSMLYISHIDWNWIKQRPQFIAEEIGKYYNLSVLYPYRYNRKGYQKGSIKSKAEIEVVPMYRIPLLDRNKNLAKINSAINKMWVKHKAKEIGAEIIYLTLPSQIYEIPDNYKGLIIYDCMDNHAAFFDDEEKQRMINSQEKDMVKKAHIIFASSQNLGNVLVKKYGVDIKSKIHICRNGYNGEIKNIENTVVPQNRLFTICYFGTISNWFNFEFIEKSLAKYDNIKYLLMGPLENTEIPVSDRIEYLGTVEHSKLYDVVKAVDCFIMPFYPTELIKSVDPVKFYEYINFNKNIISVKYEEIERFEKFVYFYEDYKSFEEQIAKLLKDNTVKYNNAQRVNFLQNSTWVARVNEMQMVINTYLKNKEME